MNIHSATVLLEMMDCIAASATNEDAGTAIEEIRRLHINGVTPSIVLQQLVENDPIVLQLKQQISLLETKLAELEHPAVEDIAAQTEPIGHTVEQIVPADDCYTMEQFLMVLVAKMRRSYGWRKDYILASQSTEGARPVDNATVQTWQNKNLVPKWAVDQIDLMTFSRRHGTHSTDWTEHDEEYLRQRYLLDPSQKNMALAKQCTEQFGRDITDNSIKGAIDRLRKRGRLPIRRGVLRVMSI